MKEETAELKKVNITMGGLTDLPKDNPRATLSSRIRALLLRMSGIPHLIYLYGTLALNKTITLDTGEDTVSSMFSDGTHLYAGLQTTPGAVVKIDLSDYTIVSTLTFDTGESGCLSVFSDGTYLYAGTEDTPGKIIKARLADFTKVDTLTFDIGEDKCQYIYSDGSYLYAGAETSPGKVIKIDIDTFTKVSTLTFAAGENFCDILYYDGSYLYAGLVTTPAKVVKIDLDTFSEVSTLTFATGENNCHAFSSDGTFLYAGLDTTPGKVIKIDIDTFTKVSTLTFAAGENRCFSLFSDGTFLYAGLHITPAKVVKMNLDTFSEVSTLTFAAGENECHALYSDGSYLYIGFRTAPGKIARRYILPANASLRERKIDRTYERQVEQSIPLAMYGKVTTYTDTTHFKTSTLGRFGDDFFKNWYVYVVRDTGGAGAAPQDELAKITDYTSSNGTFAHIAFTATLAVGDKILILHKSIAMIIAGGVGGLTSFKQESVGATDVNGTTWKDLLDKSTITQPTKICGFMVTVAGTWAGNAKIRIVDGSDNKIFPFKDEYIQGTDFFSGAQVDFTFAVVVPIADGCKIQFRSSNAADGAGDTLQLNNLDVIETG